MKNVFIMGATSAIAEATARQFAQRGARLFLAGRSAERLSSIADDLRTRGAGHVATFLIDARDTTQFDAMLQQATTALGGLDVALIAHGTLSDQQACQQSVTLTLEEFQTNALSYIALCTLLASRFEHQGHGTLALISSVAGDRGRQSNYVYGSAKAAVTAFASGLRQRLRRHNINVITIKPGFVDTPMTAAFKKGALWATPEQVGKDIYQGIVRGKQVVYTPSFWRWIMLIIKCIPERIFVRLKL